MSRHRNTPVEQHGLSTRFALVRGYFQDHVGAGPYMPVFTALDPDLKKHEDIIRKWWNNRTNINSGDAPVIERMERVVEVLKNAKAVA